MHAKIQAKHWDVPSDTIDGAALQAKRNVRGTCGPVEELAWAYSAI